MAETGSMVENLRDSHEPAKDRDFVFTRYFSPKRFTGRTKKTAAHELAMNPDTFTGRTDAPILSTVAHEMAHVW